MAEGDSIRRLTGRPHHAFADRHVLRSQVRRGVPDPALFDGDRLIEVAAVGEHLLMGSTQPRPMFADERSVQVMSDIHAIIDARAVTTVFQPLIDLAGGAVVGYEALSRGPGGSSPTDLFAAARAVGREGELDWVCRASAYRAALAAGLPADVALFVNMEPTAWRVPCPVDLSDVVARAHARLRVVTEMTERAIGDDPAALIAATAASRATGWGVALDDVGAEPASLALMPFVHPDVVKLDMQLLHKPAERYTAQVVSAVLAYAERSGATIVAEGIETEEQVRIARSMGATIGQGWHFGRPGPLPAPVRSPAAALRLLPPEDGTEVGTPYSIVSAQRASTRTSKDLLMPLSRYLESQAETASDAPVLLACFQQDRFFTPRTAERFERIARHSPFVAALAAGLAETPAPGVRGARLDPDDPLLGEWNVIVVGPHYAAALVAKEVEGGFDHVVTHDHELVVRAARSLLRCLGPVSAPPSLAYSH